MKNSIKVLGVCLLLSQTGFATSLEVGTIDYSERIANLGAVEGVVLDANGLPIAYASVEVFKGDTLIDGTLTDGDGKFSLSNIDFGTYSLKITVAGMKPYTQEITITSDKSDLGNITLNQDIIQLDEVSVRGETSKITTQIDKRVIEVGKDLVSAGATAGDVLNNIPSLNVDQQSGELSLRGNSNVRVFLDGKPSSMPPSELLKMLPSNSIEKVEIITNPSAKYNPEGNSGIINIITTKEKRKGYNVGLNAGYQHGRENRYNGSINTNWNTGKLNLFANYSGNFGKNNFYGGFDNKTTGLNQDMNLDSDNNSQLVKVGFDWFINDENALTIYTNQSFRDSEMTINSVINKLSDNSNFKDLSLTEVETRNEDYSLNYKRDFEKEGHSVELDAFYSISNGDEDTHFNWETALLNLNNTTVADKLRYYNQNQDQEITNTRIKLDYTVPFMEKGSIEAGLNYEQEGTESTMLTTQYLPTYDNMGQSVGAVEGQDTYFDFTRDIMAGYINVKYQFDKLGAQIGLRGEQVDLKADVALYGSADIADDKSQIDRDDFNFYPSVFLTYQATKADQFSINYSRRVDRPGIWSLSPIRQWQTATTRQEGNPNLKPQFTDSYELGYMHTIGRKGSINASVFYRKIHDEMSRFAFVDEVNPNITVMRRDNVDDNSSYGAEVSWYYKATNWWTMNGGLNMYKATLKSSMGTSGKTFEVDATNFTGRLSNDFTLTPTLKLQLFTMYIGPEDNLQGTRESMFRQDIGLRKSFLNQKLNITAR
ncbi:MAG: TonB-dependent receptor domain-containing protein, partial [Weeksellaceae bacterium]